MRWDRVTSFAHARRAYRPVSADGMRSTGHGGAAAASRPPPASAGSSRPGLGTWPGGSKIPLDSVRHRDYVALLRPRTPAWPYPVGRYDAATGQAHSPAPAQPLA